MARDSTPKNSPNSCLAQPDKYVIESVTHAYHGDPLDFVLRTFDDLARNNGELARRLLAEAKQLGESPTVSREDVAKRMGAWVYATLEAGATTAHFEALLAEPAGDMVPRQPDTAPLFIEPPTS